MLESERVERVVPALDESGLAVRPALEFFFFFYFILFSEEWGR